MVAPINFGQGITIGAGIGIGNMLTFGIDSTDFTTLGGHNGHVAPQGTNGTAGFIATPASGVSSGETVYGINAGVASGFSSAKQTELVNLWTNYGLNYNNSYVFTVYWGTGSSPSLGLVLLQFYYNNTNDAYINMGTIDPDQFYQITGQDIYSPTGPGNAPTALAGTFLFPATFTLHPPSYYGNNDWC